MVSPMAEIDRPVVRPRSETAGAKAAPRLNDKMRTERDMNDLERMAALEEIRQLKAKYFYHLDHKDWDGWKADVFAADAIMEVPEVGARIEGRDAIIEFVNGSIEGVKTIHHGHMPIIEFLPDGTAKGIWAMEDILFWPPNRFPGLEGRVHGYGHYHETYRREPEGWRITSLKLTRLHLGTMP